MSDDTARGISGPSFLNIPSAGPRDSTVQLSHDTMIIFGIAHVFSDVVMHPHPPPWLPFEKQLFWPLCINEEVNFSSVW